MATVTTPAAPAPQPESVSTLGRIFGVIFSPKETFESIARRPSWLVPILLLCLVSLGAVAAFSHRGGWPSYFRKQVESSSRYQQMPRDQQESVLAAQIKYGPRVAYVQVFVVPFLLAVVLASIFLGTFNLLGGTQLSFKASLAVVAYSYLTSVISGLLAILVILLKDPATVDIQNVVASNIGAYLPSEAPKWQIALFGSLDLFSIWTMILLVTGYRAAAAPKKLSFATAFIFVFGWWLVYVVLKTGATAAFT
jgi:hypothetical protein